MDLLNKKKIFEIMEKKNPNKQEDYKHMSNELHRHITHKDPKITI